MEVISLDQARHFLREKPIRTNVIDRPRLTCELVCLEPQQQDARQSFDVSDNLYVVIEGTCVVRTSASEFTLALHDALVVPPGVEHWVTNPGPERLTLLAFVAPKPSRASEVRFPRQPRDLSRPAAAARPRDRAPFTADHSSDGPTPPEAPGRAPSFRRPEAQPQRGGRPGRGPVRGRAPFDAGPGRREFSGGHENRGPRRGFGGRDGEPPARGPRPFGSRPPARRPFDRDESADGRRRAATPRDFYPRKPNQTGGSKDFGLRSGRPGPQGGGRPADTRGRAGRPNRSAGGPSAPRGRGQSGPRTSGRR